MSSSFAFLLPLLREALLARQLTSFQAFFSARMVYKQQGRAACAAL